MSSLLRWEGGLGGVGHGPAYVDADGAVVDDVGHGVEGLDVVDEVGEQVAVGDTGFEATPHIYVRLPAAFWTCGWASQLSGPETGMLLVLLVLLDTRGGRTSDRELWFSPSVADNRYTLSENARSAGVQELAASGLVVVHRRPVDPQALTYRRVRNTYTLLLDNLSRSPDEDKLPEVALAES